MRKAMLLAVLASTVTLGCSRNISPNDDSGDTSADDTGETGDTGDTEDTADTSDTSDTEDSGDAFSCQADYTSITPAPGSGEDTCVTGEVFCGDIVRGTTENGSTYYGDSWGSGEDRSWMDVMACLDDDGLGRDLYAPERVYTLDLTSAPQAVVALDDQCGDLALRAVRTKVCPGKNEASYNCNGVYINGDGDQETFPPLNSGYKWTIIIDGFDGFEGNYEFEVICD